MVGTRAGTQGWHGGGHQGRDTRWTWWRVPLRGHKLDMVAVTRAGTQVVMVAVTRAGTQVDMVAGTRAVDAE